MKRKLFNTIISCVLLTSLVGCNKTNTPAVSSGVVDEDILVAKNVDDNPAVNTCESLPPERIVLDEVPEYISNRGVILRGKDDSWRNRYIADCNLSVVSTDEEFEEFVKRFDDNPSFTNFSNGTRDAWISKNDIRGNFDYSFAIHQSYTYDEDCSDGYDMYYFEEGMSCGAPLYFDSTGKYILDTACYGIPDEVLIKFLEPEMTEVKYTPDYLGAGEEVVVTESEDIEKVLDIMHSLEVSLQKDVHSVLAMAEYQDKICFTDVNGNINEYLIIDAYIVHGEDVYYVENHEKLDKLHDLLCPKSE